MALIEARRGVSGTDATERSRGDAQQQILETVEPYDIAIDDLRDCSAEEARARLDLPIGRW